MTGPTVDLSFPPEDLAGFPVQPTESAATNLYRIFFHRHHTTGALNSPWRFSAVPPGASRFDLPVPRGTCYWSDRRYGAFVEVFRGTRMVDRKDVTRRRLYIGQPPGLHLADTTAAGAYGFGATAELSTVLPYVLPQAWAAALHRAGFNGLVAGCRHDPSLLARTLAIFGPVGTFARRTGWHTRRESIESDAVLAAELAALGVRIAPVPFTVPTIPPNT